MGKFITNYITRNTWFYIFSAVAIGLLIASFIVPPTGVIDPSVLAAAGVIFAFSALGTVIKAIDKGVDAKVQKGDTMLVVGDIVHGEGNKELLLEE